MLAHVCAIAGVSGNSMQKFSLRWTNQYALFPEDQGEVKKHLKKEQLKKQREEMEEVHQLLKLSVLFIKS